jgi:hypothetical protein
MIVRAFTCAGSYAILTMLGIKRAENRNMMPEPAKGRCAIGCSKAFCKEEYGNFVLWASQALSPEDFERIPAWREVKEWPGKIVGVCDYVARRRNDLQLEGGDLARAGRAPYQWDEGYAYWWDLSNVVFLSEPIPCRGNVGMWQMTQELAAKVVAAERALSLRIETAEDAYSLFREAVPITGDHEGFFVLSIDDQRHPVGKPVLVSLGHLTGTAAIDFREVFRDAFAKNADGIIVAHNHPSGDPSPSKEDLKLTVALRSASDLLGIKFLDHLVLGSPDSEAGRGFVSIAERQM